MSETSWSGFAKKNSPCFWRKALTGLRSQALGGLARPFLTLFPFVPDILGTQNKHRSDGDKLNNPLNANVHIHLTLTFTYLVTSYDTAEWLDDRGTSVTLKFNRRILLGCLGAEYVCSFFVLFCFAKHPTAFNCWVLEIKKKKNLFFSLWTRYELSPFALSRNKSRPSGPLTIPQQKEKCRHISNLCMDHAQCRMKGWTAQAVYCSEVITHWGYFIAERKEWSVA